MGSSICQGSGVSASSSVSGRGAYLQAALKDVATGTTAGRSVSGGRHEAPDDPELTVVCGMRWRRTWWLRSSARAAGGLLRRRRRRRCGRRQGDVKAMLDAWNSSVTPCDGHRTPHITASNQTAPCPPSERPRGTPGHSTPRRCSPSQNRLMLAQISSKTAQKAAYPPCLWDCTFIAPCRRCAVLSWHDHTSAFQHDTTPALAAVAIIPQERNAY